MSQMLSKNPKGLDGSITSPEPTAACASVCGRGANRLLVCLACFGLVCCVAMWFAAGIKNRRYRNELRNNERQVAAHIAAIRTQWEAFRQTNAGLKFVKLKATYREDGSLGVSGPVTSQVQVAQILEFLRDTHPPRPIFTNFLTVDAGLYEDSLAKVVSAANQSQPVREDTNQPSAAAGSGR